MPQEQNKRRVSDFNEYIRDRRMSFPDAMREHYRRVFRITERQKRCLNPTYPVGEIDPEIAEWSLSVLNPFSVIIPPVGGTVIDIGCGAGADCFIAALRVGREGYAIGVDPVDKNISKARELKERYQIENVEFHIGSNEQLLCADETVDLAIANFSFHLFRDHEQSLREMNRVLRRQGRIVLADCWEHTSVTYEDDPERWFYGGGGGLSIHETQSAIEAADLEFINFVAEPNRHPDDSEMLGYVLIRKP